MGQYILYSRFDICLYADVYESDKEIMTWEEMYNNALEVIRELNEEIRTLRAIVRVQLPIIEEDNENV